MYSVYNVAVDRDRSLLLIETETGGESGFRLESDTANLLIQSWGGCVGGAYTQNTDNPFSISTDPWEFLSNPNTFDVDEAFTLIEGSTTIRARFGADLLPYHYEYTARIKFGSRMNIVIIVIIVIIQSESQRNSYNTHKITTVFEIHALTLSIMHCFNCLA